MSEYTSVYFNTLFEAEENSRQALEACFDLDVADSVSCAEPFGAGPLFAMLTTVDFELSLPFDLSGILRVTSTIGG